MMSDAEYAKKIEEAAKKAESVAKMVEILRSKGIRMVVEGCGCCGSPDVEFEYDGQIIVSDSVVCFDTEEGK